MQGASDYPVWKTNLFDILTVQELWSFVSPGEEPKDVGLLPEWKKKDKVALAQIRLRVGPSALIYISGEEMTAKKAWDSLKAIYQSKGTVTLKTVNKNLTLSLLAL